MSYTRSSPISRRMGSACPASASAANFNFTLNTMRKAIIYDNQWRQIKSKLNVFYFHNLPIRHVPPDQKHRLGFVVVHLGDLGRFQVRDPCTQHAPSDVISPWALSSLTSDDLAEQWSNISWCVPPDYFERLKTTLRIWTHLVCAEHQELWLWALIRSRLTKITQDQCSLSHAIVMVIFTPYLPVSLTDDTSYR